MQKAILFLLLIAGSFTLQAQSLKDLLYGGKLKTDSNAVVRSTDDLKAKTDTGQKKPVATTEKGNPAAPVDSARKVQLPADTVAAVITAKDNAVTGTGIKEAPLPVKTNTKIWKEYTDTLVHTLQPEITNAKKIKKETYHVLVAYEIDTFGQVAITNVGITPENAVLHALLRQYMDVTPPQLHPVTDSANKPRKVKRSGSFVITKE